MKRLTAVKNKNAYNEEDEATNAIYWKLFDALQTGWEKDFRNEHKFDRIDITEKESVIRVYVDEVFIVSEFDDRFPSEETIGKIRLALL